MVKLHIFLALSAAIIASFTLQVNGLAVVLQKMEPYCFGANVHRNYEVRTSYVVSGLNEDQVEFRVRSNYHADDC